jgi:anti-sigma28 factor (negative regulator of flagellin synthesis)
MQTVNHNENRNKSQDQRDRDSAVAHIARPESVVMLAATVRAASDLYRRDRIDGLKERVSDGGYMVSSKDLAERVLSNQV